MTSLLLATLHSVFSPSNLKAQSRDAAKPLVSAARSETPHVSVQDIAADIKSLGAGSGDWPQRSGSRFRNNTPAGNNIPVDWEIGKIDRESGDWDRKNSRNIKWIARLGSQSYGQPIVAQGKIFVGTNNGTGRLLRYPPTVDLGCLICFNEADGEFLWQHSSEKLVTGRVHDWPLQGICSSPIVERDRLWFVTSRGEVRCLDTEGFYDGEDDGAVREEQIKLFSLGQRNVGEVDRNRDATAALNSGHLTQELRDRFERVGIEMPDTVAVITTTPSRHWTLETTIAGRPEHFRFVAEPNGLTVSKTISIDDRQEADVVWCFDMMHQLGVSQHNMANCSPTLWGDTLFVCTSNGVDESHTRIPAPRAPSFVALDKRTGEVLWTDDSPGQNILHGQWSSPAVGVFDDVPQVIFPGGDGWVYSFRADRWKDGKPEPLWKFDTNPKRSKWVLGGAAARNNVIAIPVIYEGLVYLSVGQDPEHGDGDGHLWCIDPTKRGDVSSHLVVNEHGKVVPHRRVQATAEWIEVWAGPDAGVAGDKLREELKSVIHQGWHRAGIPIPKEYHIEWDASRREWLVNATIDGKREQFMGYAMPMGRPADNRYRIRIHQRFSEKVVPNPNSAVVWHYDRFDQNMDGEFDFEEVMHRSISSPAIKNDLLVTADFSGLVHCLDAKSGTVYWTHDMLAACWSEPLIVEDKIYVVNEDGEVVVLQLSPEPPVTAAPTLGAGETIRHVQMPDSIFQAPVVANDVLYIATKCHLFAITNEP